MFFLHSCQVDSLNPELQTEIEPSIEQGLIDVIIDGELIGSFPSTDFTQVTERQTKMLQKKGWLYPMRAHDCVWSDGYGDGVDCDGGKCALVYHENPNGTNSVGIGCYVNEELHHAGDFRPMD